MKNSPIDQLESEARAKHAKTVAEALVRHEEEMRAAENRKDRTIEESKTILDRELGHINQLRETLGHTKAPVSDESIRGKILSVLPGRNHRFTFDEIMQALIDAYPQEKFNEQSARMVLHRIYSDGDIVRVKKTGKSVYVVAGSEIQTGRFHDMNAIDAARELLLTEGKPLTIRTIAESLIANGFETTRTATQIVQSMDSQLRKKPDEFLKVEGKWDLLPDAKASLRTKRRQKPKPHRPSTTQLVTDFLFENPGSSRETVTRAIASSVSSKNSPEKAIKQIIASLLHKGRLQRLESGGLVVVKPS